MPRTKAPKKKSRTNNIDINSEFELTLNICQELHERQKQNRDAIRKKIIEDLSQNCKLLKYGVPHPKRTIGEYRIGNSTVQKTFCDQLSTCSLIDKSIGSKQKKKRSLSCAADDDGYLTGSSLSSNASRGTRASRSKLKVQAPRKTRVSRSLSRTNAPQQIPLKNDFKTPANKIPLMKSYAMVTPKLKPNTPQVVLRRPKQGEVAISLGGSPLMVNSVTADNTANVNIPLSDGRLLCIQPERGLRYSQLPDLDAETAQQLRTLSDNIQKICAFNRS